jgi:membrane-bound metal-dependent hydrolase YbcI (DUF457 family)
MTPVGHTLTGIAIGIICLPERASRKRTLAHITTFGFLANVPDLPFEHWGHDRYRVSHSLFVNLAWILVVLGVCTIWRPARIRMGGWSVLVGGVIACLSHLLLDSFYNHGRGIAIFWPVSKAHLRLPIRWFAVAHNPRSPFRPEVGQIVGIELVCYSALVGVAVAVRRTGLRYRHSQS